MKNGSKRTISRIVAFIMIASSMFANVMVASAVEDGATPDDVVTASAVAAEEDIAPLADAAGVFTYTPSADAAEGDTLYTSDLADITAVQNLTYKPDTTATLSDGTAVTGAVVTNGSTTYGTTYLDVDGIGSKSYRIAFKVTAKSAIDVKYALKCNASKGDYAFKIDDESVINACDASKISTATSYIAAPNNTDVTAYNVQMFTLNAGDVAYIAGQGTNPDFYGVGIAEHVEAAIPELKPAEAGKTYTADFLSLGNEKGTPLGGTTYAEDTIALVGPTVYDHASGHGIAVKKGDQILVSVAGNAKITIGSCCYGATDGTYSVTDADGNEVAKDLAAYSGDTNADATDVSFNYYGPATILTIALASSGENYVHDVVVENAAVALGEAKNFMLWLDDIAADVTGEDGTVVKTIEPGVYSKVIPFVGKEGSVDLGDSSLEFVTAKGQGGESKFTPGKSDFQGLDVLDRTGVNGYWGGARHTTPNDIPAIPHDGDPTVGSSIVFTPAAAGMLNVYYWSGSFLRIWDFNTADGSRNGYSDDEVAGSKPASFAVSVQPGHTYVCSTTGKTSNLAFIAVEYVTDEQKEVTLNWSNDGLYAAHESVLCTFTDADLGTVIAKDVPYGTASLKLLNGHSYTISTNDGGSRATVNGTDSATFKVEGDTADIKMVMVPDCTLTGKIYGEGAETVTGLKFVNMVNGLEADATVAEDKTYTIALKPGDYSSVITSSGTYTTKDHVKVVEGAENTNDVYVESTVKSYYELSEEFDNASSPIKFTTATGKVNNATSVAVYTGDTIEVPVEGVKKITVGGWYQAEWYIGEEDNATTHGHATNDDKSDSCAESYYITNGTETSVTIHLLDYTGDETQDGKNAGANLSYLRYIKVSDVVSYKKKITVPGDYPTLKDAVEAIKVMDRHAGEAGRVTIQLTDDIQEQVVFDAPFVTLDGQGHEINWYYGQTGFYYSVDPATGLYNESLFQDKYTKTEGNGSLWGGVAIIRGDYFRAINTTFRNTFNYEVTDKEIEDGAEGRGKLTGLITKDTDVSVYNAKERSNCFYIEAKGIEAYDCKFLSSQDTFGRNGDADGGYSVYCKNCVIGGNTDYICGQFKALFDDCELQWFTYANDPENNAKVGYITAAKVNPFVFRNCNVTTSGKEGTDPVNGLFGRTWGKGSTAYFINCETNGYINKDAWGEMSVGDGTSATFGEYGNTVQGNPFVTNGNENITVKHLTIKESEAYTTDDVIKNVFGTDYDSTGDNYYDYPAYYDPDDYPTPPGAESFVGDVDEDGDIDIIDVSKTLQWALAPTKVQGNFNVNNADVSANGTIDSEDAAILLQKVLDSAYVMPAETATEATTEAATEAPTEESTEAPTEAPSEAPSEASTAAPATEASTAAPATEGSTEAPTDAPTEAPSEETTAAPATEASTEAPSEETTGTEPAGSVKIFVVGDSTGCHYAENADAGYYLKRVGFGDAIADYFNAEVVNLALSGRSSKSFITEPEYEQLKNELKAGDYLIIAFGHNDEKINETTRGTYPSTADAPTDSTTEGSFKKSLYDNYIKLAEDKGAIPVLCTPIVRLAANTTTGFSDSELHKTNGGDYAQDIIDLGAEKNVAVIDNTSLTKTLYETTIGFGTAATFDPTTNVMTPPTGAAALHAATRTGSVDKTHINGYGAKYIAYLMTTVDSPLKPYVKEGVTAPTEADLTAAVNPAWLPPIVGDPDIDSLQSAFWKTTSPWYATVYGDVGGSSDKIGTSVDPDSGLPLDPPIYGTDPNTGLQNFNITEVSPGNVNIKVGDVASDLKVGKVSSTADGLALYYQPFDAETNLEIKAKVKINSALLDNQVTFGALITDSIMVDTYDPSVAYNYVAASPIRLKNLTDPAKGSAADATYARIDGKLTYSGNTFTEDPTGKTVDVSIIKKGNDFTVTWDGQTATYTVPMTDKIYAGVFASRCCDIEFTDVSINNEIVE